MKKVDFLISIEIKNRETLPMILLKTELERRGFSVILEYRHRIIGNIFRRYHAKVIVVNYIRQLDHVFPAVGRTAFEKIINLRWEQIPLVSEKREWFPLSPDNMFEKCATNIWGDSVVEMNGYFDNIPKDYLFKCGCPALDLCRKDLNSIYSSKEEISKKYKIDNSKQWNLFVSSFGWKNYSIEQINEMCKIHNTDFYSRRWENEVESCGEILNWFEKLLNSDSNHIIIYRPHPTERAIDKLFRLERDYHNFYLLREEDIKQWIFVCDKVYFWWSTSIVEAYYMNKPIYVLRPYEIYNDDEIVTYTNKDSFIRSYDEFRSSLIKRWENTDSPMDQDTLDRYYHLENRYTFELLADLCEEVINNDRFTLSQGAINKINEFRKNYYRKMRLFEKLLRIFLGSPLYPLYESIFGSKNGRREMSHREIKKVEHKLKTILYNSRD